MSGHQVDSTHESRTMSRDTVSMLWKFGLMVLVGAVIFFIPAPEGAVSYTHLTLPTKA